MRDPFWKSTKVLLGYKPQLGVALGGALLSAACFGAGLGMVLPMVYFFLGEGYSLPRLLEKYANKPNAIGPLRDAALSLAQIVPDDRFQGFLIVLMIIGLLTVIGSIGRYIHEFSIVTIVGRVSLVWRGRMFRRLIHSPTAEVLRTGTADHISRINNDVYILSAGYLALLDKTASAILNGFFAILVALILNWQLTLVGLVVAPPIGILMRKLGKRIRRASKRAMLQRAHMVRAVKEALGGLMVVKVHSAEGYERRRFRQVNRALYNEEIRMRQAKALAGPAVDTLSIIGMILAASVAAWVVFRHNFEPQVLITVLALLAAGAGSLKPLAGLNNQLNESAAAAERIFNVVNLPVEPTGVDADKSLPPLPRHQQSVVFEDIHFRYPGQTRDALNGVSLTIPYGRIVAIVGANGSGKTTLLNLLPRLFEPTSGRILIDGQDIAKTDLRSLRQQMALVTQQTVLFEGTIADNIAYGRRFESSERIISAARTAHAEEFILSKPQGYQTVLGEDGSGLSGGQRQRLSIARAALRDPTILILDEATSQIDADSEAKINQAIRNLHRGRTIFIIAHRLSTVVDADMIVVMAEGKVVDQGRHAELLQRCSTYQVMIQTQLQPIATA